MSVWFPILTRGKIIQQVMVYLKADINLSFVWVWVMAELSTTFDFILTCMPATIHENAILFMEVLASLLPNLKTPKPVTLTNCIR